MKLEEETRPDPSRILPNSRGKEVGGAGAGDVNMPNVRQAGPPRATATGGLVSMIICLAFLLGLVAACRGSHDGGASLEEPAIPGFPPERPESDFPGIPYPETRDPLPRPGSLAGPVWLVGLDGATWDLIRPMAERGELPAFAALMAGGAWGVLRSEEPTISPALWATIATGMPRHVHGITNFRIKVPASYRLVEVGPPDRRSPALWDLVGAAEGTSAVISWFGSFPAEPIRGSYVSKGFDPEKLAEGQVHPEHLAAALAAEARVLMRKGDLEEIGWNEDYRGTLVEDARALAALRVVLSRDRHDFVAVYFAGLDVVQHVAWRHMDPETQAFPEDGPPDPDLAKVIPAYYRYVDHTLGRIREIAPEGTTFVIVSDHGGGPMEREEAFVPDLPPLLEALDLMEGEHGALFTLSAPYRHEKPIWLNLQGVEPSGTIDPEAAPAVARKTVERLAGLRTGTGEPVFASIRDLTAAPGWRPGEPAISVRFSHAVREAAEVIDGGRRIPARVFVSRVPGLSGSHRNEGVLILHGPAIRPGPLAEPANLYQIAPTVLYLLGLPQDSRMLAAAPADGGVIENAIDPSWLQRHPIRMISHYPGTDRSALLRAPANASALPEDPARDRELEKLRSLGYVR